MCTSFLSLSFKLSITFDVSPLVSTSELIESFAPVAVGAASRSASISALLSVSASAPELSGSIFSLKKSSKSLFPGYALGSNIFSPPTVTSSSSGMSFFRIPSKALPCVIGAPKDVLRLPVILIVPKAPSF